MQKKHKSEFLYRTHAKTYSERSRGFKTIAAVCRIVVGLLFVFSGLVKSIDPWGTALKIGEYFSAFGMEYLSWSAPCLAIGQCVLELVLGLMLLTGVWRKFSSFVTMLFMAFFTLLTLVIAIWNPVDDCGCFGDALKISNWTTFAKNAVLLPMSVVVWVGARSSRQFKGGRDTLLAVLYIAAALGLNVYSWCNLPPVDTFEYRKGTNLRSDVLCSACMERSVVLVYEDILSGETREFALSDTTWYDTSRWRYVDTRTPYDSLPEDVQEFDFSILAAGVDIAPDVVYDSGVTYIVMVRDTGVLTDKCRQQIDGFVKSLPENESGRVIFVEGFDSEDYSGGGTISLGGHEVRVAGMKRKVMARMMRADAGVVVVKDGVIIEKQPCRKLKTLIGNL